MKQKKIRFKNKLVNPHSQRYKVFAKNITCVECGMKGEFFKLGVHIDHKTVIDKNTRWHFNLYGRNKGHIVLMTKDHIIAKSKGGTDKITNYQTMCIKCNNDKKNS